MKILIISSSVYVAGGLERMVTGLASMLSDAGLDVSLLTVGNSLQSFYPISPAVTRINISADFGIGNPSGYLMRKWKLWKDARQLSNAAKALKPDIIITTEYPITAIIAAFKGGSGAKIICWHHAAFNNAKSFFWERAARYSYHKVDLIVALNNEEAGRYLKFNANTVVIPNFTRRAAAPAPLTENKLLTVARFHPAKGLDLLLRCAAIIHEKHPGWKWHYIGDDRFAAVFKTYIEEHGFPGNLVCAPAADSNLEAAYRSSSIYVMTSRFERLPMVLLEAQSHGLPCVAFDCETGPRHVIHHGNDGFLVAPENPEQLAEAITVLIEDAGKRKEMGAAAYENASKYSPEIIITKWMEVFNRLHK